MPHAARRGGMGSCGGRAGGLRRHEPGRPRDCPCAHRGHAGGMAGTAAPRRRGHRPGALVDRIFRSRAAGADRQRADGQPRPGRSGCAHRARARQPRRCRRGGLALGRRRGRGADRARPVAPACSHQRQPGPAGRLGDRSLRWAGRGPRRCAGAAGRGAGRLARRAGLAGGGSGRQLRGIAWLRGAAGAGAAGRRLARGNLAPHRAQCPRRVHGPGRRRADTRQRGAVARSGAGTAGAMRDLAEGPGRGDGAGRAGTARAPGRRHRDDAGASSHCRAEPAGRVAGPAP